MSEIDINVSAAKSVSLKFSQTASALSQMPAPKVMIEKTNITGANSAIDTLERLVSAGHKISDALVRDGNNIHSVAQEFAAIDQKISKGFEGLRLVSKTERG